MDQLPEKQPPNVEEEPKGKVQPWKQFASLLTSSETFEKYGTTFENSESVLRLRCEADNKSLGG
jgi:hypothetical protein